MGDYCKMTPMMTQAKKEGCEFDHRQGLSQTAPINEVLELNSFTQNEKMPSLAIASAAGGTQTLKLLLKEFSDVADVDQVGELMTKTICNDDAKCFSDVTALWCLCALRSGNGNFLASIKLLLDNGANVNHRAGNGATPIWALLALSPLSSAECLEVAKYLIHRGADVNVATHSGETCLMAAVQNRSASLVEELISSGADVKVRDLMSGYTALHWAAASSKDTTLLPILLDKDLDSLKDLHGLTPLHIAALEAQVQNFESLYSFLPLHPVEFIDATELLGATLALSQDWELCFQYFHRAMLLRCSDNQRHISKCVQSSASWNFHLRPECQSLSELEALAGDPVGLATEALLVMQRILGHQHPRFTQAEAMFWLGTIIGTNNNEEEPEVLYQVVKCWMCALKLYWKACRLALASEVLFAIAGFAFSMTTVEPSVLKFNDLLSIVDVAINIINVQRSCTQEQGHPLCPMDSSSSLDTYQLNVLSTVILIMLLDNRVESKADRFTTLNLMKKVLAHNPTCSIPRDDILVSVCTPLHLACIPNGFTLLPQLSGLQEDSWSPNLSFIKLLLDAGADPNALDGQGNTSLHLLVQQDNCQSKAEVDITDAISLLLSSGCHLDWKNYSGKTAEEVTQSCSRVRQLLLRVWKPLPLKCICAQIISNHSLQIEGLPSVLRELVRGH